MQAIDRSAQIVPINEPLTPMHMLERAVSSGATIEIIEKMMALQERWEATQARKDFDAAIAAAKSEIPTIRKATKGHNKNYADFASIAKVVDPIITKHGLSYRFRTRQDERIHVTCVLSHRSGHSEETTLAGPADTSGNKNAIQAIGSTLTYLQRYSLVQALGLAAADDDDGAGGAGATITDDDTQNLRDMLAAKGIPEERLLTWASIDKLGKLPATKYEAAVDVIKATKSRKEGE